jgi:hypothetical protein
MTPVASPSSRDEWCRVLFDVGEMGHMAGLRDLRDSCELWRLTARHDIFSIHGMASHVPTRTGINCIAVCLKETCGTTLEFNNLDLK